MARVKEIGGRLENSGNDEEIFEIVDYTTASDWER